MHIRQTILLFSRMTQQMHKKCKTFNTKGQTENLDEFTDSVLVSGCSTWTLTRMLRLVLNIYRNYHHTKQRLREPLPAPTISSEQRIRFAGARAKKIGQHFDNICAKAWPYQCWKSEKYIPWTTGIRCKLQRRKPEGAVECRNRD